MIVWIDSEDGRRGGSIYLQRFHRYLIDRGIRSRYELVNSLRHRIFLIAMTWISDYEIRGTVPRELPTLLFCKRKRGYIQSPMEEWSLLSRLTLRLLMKGNGARAKLVCVSRTTQRSAEARGCRVFCIEYAKLNKISRVSRTEYNDKELEELVLVVMDNQLIDKGYLRHLSIIAAIEGDNNVIVEVYGRRNGIAYTCKGKTHYNGFKADPFQDAMEKSRGKRVLYLGCSRFEGLHMAVVEAAIAGIPSILSDIPAHRELEKISGMPLMLGKDVCESIGMVRKIAQREEYIREVRKCEYLASTFGELCMVDGGY